VLHDNSSYLRTCRSQQSGKALEPHGCCTRNLEIPLRDADSEASRKTENLLVEMPAFLAVEARWHGNRGLESHQSRRSPVLTQCTLCRCNICSENACLKLFHQRLAKILDINLSSGCVFHFKPWGRRTIPTSCSACKASPRTQQVEGMFGLRPGYACG
jgi:hypothetical protein